MNLWTLLAQTGASMPPPADAVGELGALLKTFGAPTGWVILVLVVGRLALKLRPLIDGIGAVIQAVMAKHQEMVSETIAQARELNAQMRDTANEFSAASKQAAEAHAATSRALEVVILQARELLREATSSRDAARAGKPPGT